LEVLSVSKKERNPNFKAKKMNCHGTGFGFLFAGNFHFFSGAADCIGIGPF